MSVTCSVNISYIFNNELALIEKPKFGVKINATFQKSLFLIDNDKNDNLTVSEIPALFSNHDDQLQI